MGSGGGTNTVTQNANTAPWNVQQPYIAQGLQQAQQDYQTNLNAGPYPGSFTANSNNAYNQDAQTYSAGYAGGAGSDNASAVSGTASPLIANAGTYAANAGNLATGGLGAVNSGLYGALEGYGTGTNSIAGPSAGLSSALNTAGVNGAGAINNFTQGLEGAASTASTNPNSGILSNATAIENASPVQQQETAANNLIQQQLQEQTLPGLNQQAAMGGGLNSSRAGMAEGLANEGASLAEGQTDASLFNNAFNSGLSTATNEYGTNLGASIQANTAGLSGEDAVAQGTAGLQQQLGEANATDQLGADSTGLSLGASTALNANAQVGNAANMGYTAASEGASLAGNNANLYSNAGSLETSGAQSQDTNALQQWEENNQYDTGILSNYMNVAGQPLGTSSNTSGTSTTSGPGIAATAAGLGTGAIGLNALLQSSGLYGGLANLGTAGAAAATGLPTVAASSLGTSGALAGAMGSNALITGGAGANTLSGALSGLYTGASTWLGSLFSAAPAVAAAGSPIGL